MKTEELLLNMFTCFVREQEFTERDLILEEEEWGRLLSMASYHQIIPMIYETARQVDSFRNHPPAAAALWKRETMIAVARQMQMTGEFLLLYKAMQEAGMDALVVKGLVCRNLYPKPDYRMSGDEDLLVKREDFWKLNDFLIERGFFKDQEDEELERKMADLHEVGYRNKRTGLYLEIHLSLFPRESGAYGHFDQLFTGLHSMAVSVDIEGCKIHTLDYTEHFLYLLCHSAKHFLHSGFGVRQVFDMILFAEEYGKYIDWDKIIRVTKENQIYVFMVNLLDIGVKYMQFDPGKACWPSDEACLDGSMDSEDLLYDLLAGGIYGASSEERLHSSNITLAAANKEEKIGGLRASLFPKRSYMEQKYEYVKKHPWLLPVGWGHRIAEYMTKKNKTDNLKVVETGNQRVKMLKKYGMID